MANSTVEDVSTLISFTQGKTLDELVENLKKAIQLHFEDDPESLADFSAHPSLFTMMDLGEIHV